MIQSLPCQTIKSYFSPITFFRYIIHFLDSPIMILSTLNLKNYKIKLHTSDLNYKQNEVNKELQYNLNQLNKELFYNLKVQFQNLIILAMDMAHKSDDLDYQPDVLKFKQIWNQMKQTNKNKGFNKSHEETKDKSKIQLKEKSQIQQKSKGKEMKKQTVLSQKNIQRNPKHDPEKVIQFTTNPQGFYQNSLKNQKNNVDKQTLIETAITPSAISEIKSYKKAIQQKDYELSLLRVSNTRNEDRIKVLEDLISQKDEKIWVLECRQRQLLSNKNALIEGQKIFEYGKIQYQNYKNDTKRLLKMLQTTNQFQQFANLALDDNGIRFLNQANKKFKSHLDTKQKSVLHFCTCNKQFIPESGFWVPQKVYSFGKEFVKNRRGELTQAELQLMLYDLNRIWRQRQKRIINTLNAQKARQIGQIKRKSKRNHSKLKNTDNK